ncbi:cytochrome c family protein [Sphingomonas sp. ASV193]|uniref:c-type cytochrome n=1 Tax=Sphingomonas sp. ASV193 TaxID=3144405 RepID=UPI0032E92388
MLSTKTLVGLAGMTALLAACGGGDKSADQSASTDTSATANAAGTTDANAMTNTAAAGAPATAAKVAADDTTTTDGTKLASFKGDAVHGKVIFTQCQACHSGDAGKNMIGPSLHGVIGRKAGTEAGFQYSDANKTSGITWTPDKVFQYLQAPQRVVPGTKMTFAGLPQAQDRADVIAYLETLK